MSEKPMTFDEAKKMLESIRDDAFIAGQTLEQMKGVDRRTVYGRHIASWYRRKVDSVDGFIREKAALIAGVETNGQIAPKSETKP